MMGRHEKRTARLRITQLLDQCQGCPKHNSFVRHVSQVEAICGGCAVYKELRELGDGLQTGEYGNEISRILAKGQDMTKTDIAYLLHEGVLKKEIRKALKMSSDDFTDLMISFGFSKRHPERSHKNKKKGDGVKMEAQKQTAEPLDLTIDEYVGYVQAGMDDTAIREKKGFTKQQLYSWKNYRKHKINAALSKVSTVKETTIAVQPAPVESHDPAPVLKPVLVAKPDDFTEGFAALVEEVKAKDGRIAALHAASDDIEKELDEVKQERDKLIKKVRDDSYLIENLGHDLVVLKGRNAELEEENVLLRKLVKQWA